MMRADWGVRRSDGFIAWSPLSHMAAADPTLASLMQGATVTLLPGFDPPGIVEALMQHSVGWMILMPGMIERLAEELEQRNALPVRVAAAGCMANLVPAEQIARISRLLAAPFLNSFGSTETGIAPASGNWIAPGEAPLSLGKLQSTACEIRLVDPAGRDVPEGQTGEIWLRSPGLFSGYWADPQATAEAFAGGWYRMGDDFRRDAEGLLHFADRSKYLIKSGGENIYPAEIELILRNLDGVSDAVVVRRPDPKWGEVPVAFIVAAPDRRPSTGQVRAALEARLARFKLPKEIHFIEDQDIERNTTGKIRRDLLERRALAGTREEEIG
jgi:fatty-acyl-CoA synthase